MADPIIGWVKGADGLQLRWLRWDASTGPARGGGLVVHGFGDHAGRYRDVAALLGGRGLTVAAYDQRGHGASEGRKGDAPSFESFLLDLDAMWREAVRTLPHPLFLYGHSFGALVVMRWIETRFGAAARPAPDLPRPTAVVLSAPWLALKLAVPRWKLIASKVMLHLAPGLRIASGSDNPEALTRDPERQAEYLADPLVHHQISPRFHAGVLDAQAAVMSGAWPDVPTLLVLPGDDPLIDAATSARWAARHPEVLVYVREGGRHELHNDIDRTEAIGRIGDWLEGRLRAEPGAPGRVLAAGN